MKEFLDFLYNYVDIDNLFIYDPINKCISLDDSCKFLEPLLILFMK